MEMMPPVVEYLSETIRNRRDQTSSSRRSWMRITSQAHIMPYTPQLAAIANLKSPPTSLLPPGKSNTLNTSYSTSASTQHDSESLILRPQKSTII